MPTISHLDHLVIAAGTLQQGCDYIRAQLAVDIPAGGKHNTMGTHNCLMQLGSGVYIEVIAIDPDAAAPPHPRWFNLDDALMRASLRRRPRLITWVINTPDIHRLQQNAVLPIGLPTELSRDNLSWRLGATEDGRLLANGLVPYVIQWHTQPHPSAAMADRGCRLRTLKLHHNRPAWLHSVLRAMAADHLVKIHPLPDSEAPCLSAGIDTPHGSVNLSSWPV